MTHSSTAVNRCPATWRWGSSFWLTVFAVLVLTGCEKPAVEAEPVVRPVKVQTIGEAGQGAYREYPGTLRATQNAEMGFEVGGRVVEFLVKEGDVVEEGQVLARLDARDYQAELDAVAADLRKAEADLNRSSSIYRQDPGAISKETLDSDRRAVDVAKARYAVAEKALQDTELRAPFDGRVARKLVEDFANVAAKEAVLVVQDTSTMEVQVDLPERDVVLMPVGLSYEQMDRQAKPVVTLSALPGQEYPARVNEFAKAADPVTRTFSVKLVFQTPDDVTLLPGMTARVRVLVDHSSAWSLPVTAVQSDAGGEPFVWVVDEDSLTVSRTVVQVGQMTGDSIRVEEGLQAGQMVAVSGVTYLREGMEVRLLER